MRGTPGTETSKYREEEKSTEIPRVVASESGRGQTDGSNTVGVRTVKRTSDQAEWCGKANHRRWESCKRKEGRQTVSRVPSGTWNPMGRWGDHPPSLNTTWWPIVEQYCEGKVKRTPGGEWNRTWNLMFTSTQSTLRCDVVLFVERSGELLYAARLSY